MNGDERKLRIIRVFPRRTRGTPTDEMAFVGSPPLWRPEADEVHISVTFTWDIPLALWLDQQWRMCGYKVRMGGPALGTLAGGFEPGMYVRPGYVFTTRGCPNDCWFCMVRQREGTFRELPIRQGWEVLDNNLLAASRGHIERVFDMLRTQPARARFTGGFDAERVEPWHGELLASVRTAQGYTAYDVPEDRKHLRNAVTILSPHFWHRRLGCYVLCGYPGDTIEAARERCQFTADVGAVPFPMYFRGPEWKPVWRVPSDWHAFIRRHARGIPDEITTVEPNSCGGDR